MGQRGTGRGPPILSCWKHHSTKPTWTSFPFCKAWALVTRLRTGLQFTGDKTWSFSPVLNGATSWIHQADGGSATWDTWMVSEWSSANIAVRLEASLKWKQRSPCEVISLRLWPLEGVSLWVKWFTSFPHGIESTKIKNLMCESSCVQTPCWRLSAKLLALQPCNSTAEAKLLCKDVGNFFVRKSMDYFMASLDCSHQNCQNQGLELQCFLNSCSSTPQTSEGSHRIPRPCKGIQANQLKNDRKNIRSHRCPAIFLRFQDPEVLPCVVEAFSHATKQSVTPSLAGDFVRFCAGNSDLILASTCYFCWKSKHFAKTSLLQLFVPPFLRLSKSLDSYATEVAYRIHCYFETSLLAPVLAKYEAQHQRRKTVSWAVVNGSFSLGQQWSSSWAVLGLVWQLGIPHRTWHVALLSFVALVFQSWPEAKVRNANAFPRPLATITLVPEIF